MGCFCCMLWVINPIVQTSYAAFAWIWTESPVYIRFLSGATSWVNTNDSVPQAIHATTLSPFLTDNVLSIMSCSFLSPYFVSLTNLLILLQLLFSSIQRFYFKLDTLLRCFLTFGNDMPSFLRVFLTWLCVAEGFY